MKLTILGCSGGIGIGLRTTAMLLDDDVLIDAGTGVGDLTLDRMARIDAVFLTHSHLKPDDSAATVAEIGRLLPNFTADRPLRMLSRNQVLAF